MDNAQEKRPPTDSATSSPDADNTQPACYQLIEVETARKRLGGANDSMLAELAKILREEAARRITEIEEALGNGDAILVARGAHTLKGAAANFGAGQLIKIAEQIEDLGSDSELATVPALLQQLKVQAEILDQELTSFMAATAEP